MIFLDIIAGYLSDKHSPFHKVRYATKRSYCRQLARLRDDLGDRELSTLRARDFIDVHEKWMAGGAHVPMAHSLATMLRIVIGFGATILEEPECQRLRGILAGLRFKTPRKRTLIITDNQVTTVRDVMSMWDYHAMALACAVQSDCGLRQKDVIGEWIPVDADPETPAIVVADGMKWVRGITREEISDDLILTHKTSKRGQVLSFDLKKCPAVNEEWFSAPPSGPLIIDPETGLPYQAWKFRRLWREFANMAGVPKGVWNMDARAGRITELLANGATLEDARKFAGHEQQTTTSRYSRGNDAAIDRVLSMRGKG
jgi:hypothetical protein